MFRASQEIKLGLVQEVNQTNTEGEGTVRGKWKTILTQACLYTHMNPHVKTCKSKNKLAPPRVL